MKNRRSKSTERQSENEGEGPGDGHLLVPVFVLEGSGSLEIALARLGARGTNGSK